MKMNALVVTLLASMMLVACGDGSKNESSSSKEMDEKDIKQLVDDYSAGNIENESASITSTQLIVTDSNEKKTVYDLPDDSFFVSIAPYVNETHP